MFRRPSFLSLTCLLLLGVNSMFGVTEEEAHDDSGIKLACVVSDNSRQSATKLECDLSNDTNTDIFVLSSPLTLEGQLEDEDYVYRFSAGERFENVLEFRRGVWENISRGGLFHLAVDVQKNELQSLWKIPKNKSGEIIVFLSDETIKNFDRESWTFIVKIVFATRRSLEAISSRVGFSGECRHFVLESISRARFGDGKMRIGMRSPPGGTRYTDGSCLNRASWGFNHLYSNVVVLSRTDD
jgi:hypothetical protein